MSKRSTANRQIAELKKSVSGLQDSIGVIAAHMAKMSAGVANVPPKPRPAYAGIEQACADQGKRNVTAALELLKKAGVADNPAIEPILTQIAGEPIAALMQTAQLHAARANGVEDMLVELVQTKLDGAWPVDGSALYVHKEAYEQIRQRVENRRLTAAAEAAKVASAKKAARRPGKAANSNRRKPGKRVAA